MKSVLISTRPNWCEKICHKIGENADGTPIYEKSVEVRKTKPKLETPFKVYIYCTKNNRKYALRTYINSGCGRKEFGIIGHWRSGKDVVDVNSHLLAYRYNSYLAEGKVIGEFVCDKMYFWNCDIHDYDTIALEALSELSCVSEDDLLKYADRGNLYGWHISDLVIYDKPRELSEFKTFCKSYYEGDKCDDCKYLIDGRGYEYDESDCGCKGFKPIERPPQSWCYVEEVHI